MPEKTETPAATQEQSDMSKQPLSTEERLAQIETLLEQQNKYAKRSYHLRVFSFILSVAAVLALCIGLGIAVSSVNRVTSEVSSFISTTEASVEDITAEFAKVGEGIGKIDFESVADAVEGIRDAVNEMDFKALNESIENLKEVSENLAQLTSVFR